MGNQERVHAYEDLGIWFATIGLALDAKRNLLGKAVGQKILTPDKSRHLLTLNFADPVGNSLLTYHGKFERGKGIDIFDQHRSESTTQRYLPSFVDTISHEFGNYLPTLTILDIEGPRGVSSLRERKIIPTESGRWIMWVGAEMDGRDRANCSSDGALELTFSLNGAEKEWRIISERELRAYPLGFNSHLLPVE